LRAGLFFADAVPAGADRVGFAFVNCTTLEYGDIVTVERRKLLDPIRGDERCATIQLVDRPYFRGAAEGADFVKHVDLVAVTEESGPPGDRRRRPLRRLAAYLPG
jgi:hypothetical protein